MWIRSHEIEVMYEQNVRQGEAPSAAYVATQARPHDSPESSRLPLIQQAFHIAPVKRSNPR
jgi:hypothetical protein